MSEIDVSELLTVAEAIQIIDAAAIRPRVITLPLAESLGMRLAENLQADRDEPAADRSLMDGYAVKAADLATFPAELAVVAHIAAGGSSKNPLQPGQAMAIMTGAPIPTGADSVVPVEYTQGAFVPAGGRVKINKGIFPRNNVLAQASNVRAGQTVLQIGAILGPAQIAVAASVGASQVKVFDRARASILATGDELVGAELVPEREQQRDGNSPMLLALLRQMGCEVRDVGIARDEPARIREGIENGLGGDVLLITGGMSMGEFDYVPRMIAEMGGRLRITKLRIKPGKPFVFAEMPGGKFIFGLPGNPVSAYVCTIRLASRLLRRMMGGPAEQGFREMRLAEPLAGNGSREFYQPAQIHTDGVHPLAWKGSADIYTLAKADALIVRPADDPGRQIGDSVMILDVR